MDWLIDVKRMPVRIVYPATNPYAYGGSLDQQGHSWRMVGYCVRCPSGDFWICDLEYLIG